MMRGQPVDGYETIKAHKKKVYRDVYFAMKLIDAYPSSVLHGYVTDFTERTHPISTKGPTPYQVVPLRFSELSDEGCYLAGWRRIQLMTKERTSVRMQAQIKTLFDQGHAIRSIARILRLSRRTVRKFLEPASEPAAEGGGRRDTVNWEYVRQEVYGKGTTVKQIQREVAPDIAYLKFWRAFREQVGRQAYPVK
jgi:hypothetical protein